jgi:hypothetical protein
VSKVAHCAGYIPSSSTIIAMSVLQLYYAINYYIVQLLKIIAREKDRGLGPTDNLTILKLIFVKNSVKDS